MHTAEPVTRRQPESWRTRFARLRREHRWLDHLAVALARYVNYQGYQYAASITYFSVLSLVPLVMVALSVVSFVLAGQPALLGQLRQAIGQAIPPALDGEVGTLVNNLIDHRLKIGVFGLLVALYSGWNWMNALRDALTAMWDRQRPASPFLRTVLRDLLALLGLFGALIGSVAITAGGGALGSLLLRLVGLTSAGWARTLLGVLVVLLDVAASWLVFGWVLAKLPREPVPFRAAARGALGAAVGFEVLKQVGSFYLRAIGSSPIGVAFGSVIGLLVFAYLVARLLLVAAAWTATSTAPAPPASDGAGN